MGRVNVVMSTMEVHIPMYVQWSAILNASLVFFGGDTLQVLEVGDAFCIT